MFRCQNEKHNNRAYIYWYVGCPTSASSTIDLLHFDKTSAIQCIKKALYDFEVDD